MKKFVLTAITLALSAGSALAADLPSRKAPVVPPPPPPPMWAGFYAGINAGWAGGQSNINFAPSGAWIGDPDYLGVVSAGTRNIGTSGATAGGQVGYLHQIDKFVGGIEVDGGYLGTSGNYNAGPFIGARGQGVYTGSGSVSGNWLLTVRGRLGYTVLPDLLVYATGGLAVADYNLNSRVYYNNPVAAPPAPPAPPPVDNLPLTPPIGGMNSVSAATTQVGWTVGGGVEWMLLPNWSAKVEYLYTQLATQNALSTYVSPNSTSVWAATHSNQISLNVVRAGLNYHFNWAGAPVVAKY